MLRRLWYPPILSYHRIHPDRGKETPTLTPEHFERQMALIAQGWHPISLSMLVESLEDNRRLPSRAVVVTFDDGTDDFWTYAVPILRRYRIPATLFMIAGNVGRCGFLSIDQLKAIADLGIAVGSHTLHHDYLPSLPLAKVEESLSVSKERLAQWVGSVEFLSYPAGGYTPEIVAIVRAMGYRAACTTNRGTRRVPADRWALRRITAHERMSARWFMELCLSGYYGLNRRLRSPA